jgi:3-oxoacyl-[acyl-carrier-protein] synthase III
VDIATSTAVRPEEEAPSGQGILSTVRLASESVTTLLEKLDLTRGAFTHVVLPNYRPAAQKFVVAALRMPADRLLLGPVTELGHCFSADVLITLHQHRSVHSLVPGDRVLASVSGPHSWSTLAFECV